MATFSTGLLTGLGQPAMLQDFRLMGAALGGVPQARREQQRRQSLAKHDTGTYEGQLAMLNEQLQYEKDPAARAQINRSIMQVREAKAVADAKSRQSVARGVLVDKLRAAGRNDLAAQIEAGNMQASQGVAALNQISEDSKTLASRKGAIDRMGIGGTSAIAGASDEDIANMSATEYSIAVRIGAAEAERNKFADILSDRGANSKIVEDVRSGMMTAAQARAAIASGEEYDYTNRRIMLRGDTPVFVADVTRNGKKRPAVMNPETGQWEDVTDPSTLTSVDKKGGVSNVSRVDIENAGNFLSTENNNYEGYSNKEKTYANLAVAAKAKALLASGKAEHQIEALEMASADLPPAKDNGWDFLGLWDTVLGSSRQTVSKESSQPVKVGGYSVEVLEEDE